jgi:hypothetical protein
MNSEMSGLRQEQRQADQRLRDLDQQLTNIVGEISELDRRAHTELEAGANLVLDEYRMLRAYLDHKQRVRVTNERQRGFARKQLEKIDGEVTRQGLKIRGMENLLERRLRELQLDMEKKQMSMLDEAWLQRPGDQS